MMYEIKEKNPMPGHSARLCVHGYFYCCGPGVAWKVEPTQRARPAETLTDAFKKSMLHFLLPLPFPLVGRGSNKISQQKQARLNKSAHSVSQVSNQHLRGSVSLSLKWEEGSPCAPCSHMWPWLGPAVHTCLWSCITSIKHFLTWPTCRYIHELRVYNPSHHHQPQGHI